MKANKDIIFNVLKANKNIQELEAELAKKGTQSKPETTTYTTQDGKIEAAQEGKIYMMRFAEKMSKSDYFLTFLKGFCFIGSPYGGSISVLCEPRPYSFKTRHEPNFAPVTKEVFNQLVSECLTQPDLELRGYSRLMLEQVVHRNQQQEVRDALGKLRFNEFKLVRP